MNFQAFSFLPQIKRILGTLVTHRTTLITFQLILTILMTGKTSVCESKATGNYYQSYIPPDNPRLSEGDQRQFHQPIPETHQSQGVYIQDPSYRRYPVVRDTTLDDIKIGLGQKHQYHYTKTGGPASKSKPDDKLFYISDEAEAQEGFEGDRIDRFWANIGPLLFPLPFFLASLIFAAPVIPYTLFLQYNNTEFLG